jgi:hypothetical protein
MSNFTDAAIAQADLVRGTMYAMLLISKNVWTYGVYNGDHVQVTVTAKMPLFTMRNIVKGADQVMTRTGPGEFDRGEVLFYPTTHDVAAMVHAYREKWRLHDAEDGGGWTGIVRLRRIGWTLAAWAAASDASVDTWFSLLDKDAEQSDWY